MNPVEIPFPPFIINPMWQNPHPALEAALQINLPDWQSLDMTGTLPNSSLIKGKNRFFLPQDSVCECVDDYSLHQNYLIS